MHLECDGVLLALPLDIVEVPRVSIDLQHCQNIEMFVLHQQTGTVTGRAGRASQSCTELYSSPQQFHFTDVVPYWRGVGRRVRKNSGRIRNFRKGT